jgi:hypothetical protein
MAKDKHSTGSFYTPSHITGYMASRAIDARALEMLARSSSRSYPSMEKVLASAPVKDLKALYFSVLVDLKVLDPACGEGAFLVSCRDHLLSLRERCLQALDERKFKDRRFKAEMKAIRKDGGLPGREVLERNIFGVDLDEAALKVCRKNLSKGISGRKGLNLKHGNSLLGFVTLPAQTSISDFGAVTRRPAYKRAELDEMYLTHLSRKVKKVHVAPLRERPLFHWSYEFPEVMASGGFDVIVGNPPYGDRALSGPERAAVRATYTHGTTVTDKDGKGSVNPSSVFIERSHLVLGRGGQMAFILPSSMTRVREFEKTRRFLLETTSIWHVVDEGAPFEGITLEMFTLFARKGRPEPEGNVRVGTRREGDEGREWTVPVSVFKRYGRFMLYWDQAFDRISKGAFFGFVSGKRGPTVPRKRYQRKRDGAHPVPLLVSGKCIQRYRLVPSEFHWAQERALSAPGVETLHRSRLLVGTRLKDHYRVCIKPTGHAVADNVIRLKFEEARATPEAMCVILNSRLLRFVVARYLFNCSRLTMFIQSVAEATPIKVPADLDLFTNVGFAMLELGQDRPRSRERFEAMDRLVANPLVYELYLHGPSGTPLADKLSGARPEELRAMVEKDGLDRDTNDLIENIYSDPIVKRIESEL